MKQYIHYGSDRYNPRMFKPIKNIRCFTKPEGGLWASAVDAGYGWKDWCKDNNFAECREDKSFRFTLDPDAKVLRIDSMECLAGLPEAKDEFSYSGFTHLNFEELLRSGWDAIELVDIYAPGLYMALYGWDCDSILVMNPNCIEEIIHVGDS